MSRGQRASARQHFLSLAARAPGCVSSGTASVEQARWANERVWKLPIRWRSEGRCPWRGDDSVWCQRAIARQCVPRSACRMSPPKQVPKKPTFWVPPRFLTVGRHRLMHLVMLSPSPHKGYHSPGVSSEAITTKAGTQRVHVFCTSQIFHRTLSGA